MVYLYSTEYQFSFPGSLDDEQQYFADILIAIKAVMGSHLQEVQDKFQHRFEKLEDEVRNRDETINKLKARILELEKSQEDSFTVNIFFYPSYFAPILHFSTTGTI